MKWYWNKYLATVLLSGILLAQDVEPDAEGGDTLPLDEVQTFQLGLDAMSGRMWKVAAARFTEGIKVEGVSANDRLTIRWHLVEALIRGGNGEKALEMLGERDLTGQPVSRFWRAQALADLGRYREAIDELEAYPESAPHWVEAQMTMTRLHWMIGDSVSALATLDRLLDARMEFVDAKLLKAKIWFDQGRYQEVVDTVSGLEEMAPAQQAVANRLRARSHLQLGQSGQALTWFQKLVESPKHQSLASYHANVIDLARVQIMQGEREEAADRLLAFMQKRPDSPLLRDAFDVLNACLPENPKPNDPILSRLEEWIPPRQVSGYDLILGNAQDRAGAVMPGPGLADNPLEPFALYHMAVGLRRQSVTGAAERARQLLTRLRWEYPQHPLTYRALMRLGEWEMEAGEVERGRRYLKALADLVEANPDLRARAMALEAAILFERGSYQKAAQNFVRVADFLEAGQRDQALRNAATAFLAGDNLDAFQQIVKEVERDELERSLALERALYLTATRDPGALLRLLEFIEQFPDHPRVAEARLNAALAALDVVPAKAGVAAEQLAILSEEARSELPAELLVVAEIRLKQHQRDWAGAAQRAKDFLQANPESDSWVLITFERGKALFQNKDYHNARLVLEELVNRAPDVTQAPAAILLAARAAAEGGTPQSQRESLEMFGKLIESDSIYAGVARLEKADLHIRLTELEEAIALLRPWFDSMEEGDPLLYAAGMLLGDALVAQAQGKTGMLEQALGVFDRLLATLPEGSLRRQRVIYQKGLVLEQLEGRTGEALEVLTGVVHSAQSQSRGDWEAIERCGFAALRILERNEDWHAAKLLAERMASLNGPRADEAAERAKTIGLKHFIWDR